MKLSWHQRPPRMQSAGQLDLNTVLFWAVMCGAAVHILLFFLVPFDSPQERYVSALRPLGTALVLLMIWRTSLRETVRIRWALRCLFGAFVTITCSVIYRLFYGETVTTSWSYWYSTLVFSCSLMSIGLYLEQSKLWVGNFWRVLLIGAMIACACFVLMQSALLHVLPTALRGAMVNTRLLYIAADIGTAFALLVVLARKMVVALQAVPYLIFAVVCLLLSDAFGLVFNIMEWPLRLHWPLYVMNIALLARSADVYANSRAIPRASAHEDLTLLIDWSLWAVAPLVLAGAALIVHGQIFAGIHIPFAALIAITIVHEIVAVSDYRRVLTNLREAQAQLRQALEQIEELTISRERQRLAREIHDGMGGHLHAADRLLSALTDYQTADARQQRMIALLAREVEHTQREMRRAISALDSDPAELSVEELLAGPVHDAQVYGVQIELRLTGPSRPLSTAARHTLYRVVQEAITNIGRHARATSGVVTLDFSDPAALVVTIADNGVGMPGGVARAGNGLSNMCARVEALGGQFAHVPSTQGVTLWFKLPT